MHSARDKYDANTDTTSDFKYQWVGKYSKQNLPAENVCYFQLSEVFWP